MQTTQTGTPITFQPKSVILANPRGFCAGVDRAIAIVDRALEKFGAPIYVRHEVVHNKHVVDDLKSRGAIFVEELKDVPDLPGGAVVIYSAHGVSKALQAEAAERMGITQPKVSALLRGELSNLSERKLMDCLNRLGYNIEIKVRLATKRVGHLKLAIA